MWGLWHWATTSENAPIIGALGLLLAAVGFPLTLIQLWRTKRAADAATDAANSARLRMNSFGALRECENARAQAREVNDAIGRNDWDAALVNYQGLSTSLVQLKQCNVSFDSDVISALDRGIGVIDANCAVLERALRTDASRLTKGKQFSALRPLDAIIAKAMFNLERLSS